MPLVQPRTTVDCSGLPVYDFSKLFNKEEIGKGVYGAVFTADYPFNGIDDEGSRVSSFGCFVFEFWVLRFRDLGVFVFEFWVLSFRFRVLRFRDLGSSFSSFGCFVFEIWVLRASVFVFEGFVFETTHKRVGVALQATVETLYEN